MFRPESRATPMQVSPDDSTLGRLIDELTHKLQADEPVYLQIYLDQYPEHAQELSRIFPALERLAELGRSEAKIQSPGGILTVWDDDGKPGVGVLGDFRLLREVGRGGMGVVYEAEQVSLRRRVALKVLPLAGALDSKQLNRFQTEAQAAACLHHTHIVPVHAVGCERGVHYYAMQFIEGHSLAELIKELRRLEGLEPTNQAASSGDGSSTSTLAAALISGRYAAQFGDPGEQAKPAAPGDRPRDRSESDAALPFSKRGPAAMPPGSSSPPDSGSSTRSRAYIRTVAQFGVQVAEALDHAHTRGILHRDIKPGNLLLDEPGQLWVADFGLAQVQGNPCLTLTGDIIGTLRYMSPEQALGKRVVIDGRTDIYSLGVTLYELLTLHPAVDGQDRQEILRKLAEEEPTPPRKLNSEVPRDLETVVLKAMAREPEGRYATAKDVTDDLRRFLEHKPIKARRPSPLDQAAKWTRRHRPMVASITASTFLFLSLAIIVLASSNLRIQQEQKRADEQKERAEANSRTARKVVDRMFTRVAEDLAHTPRMEKVRRALLVDALEFYQGFLNEKSSDPVVRYETASAYMRVADIQAVLGRFSLAVEPWHHAVALLEKLAAQFPSMPEYQRDLALCHRELSHVYYNVRQQGGKSLEERRAEFRIREKLVAEFPTVPDYRRELARNHTEFGLTLEREGRSPIEAEDHLRKALNVWDEIRKDFPEVPEDRYGRANSHHWLGSLLMHAGRLPEAEQELRKALALAEQSLADKPDSDDFRSRLAHIQDYLGQAMMESGQPAEAEDLFRRSIRLYESAVEDFPDTPDYLRRVSLVYNSLGESLRAMRRVQEAENALRHAIELRLKFETRRSDPKIESATVSSMYETLGLLSHESGRVQEAADAFRRAQAGYERAAEEDPDRFWVRVQYAWFLTNCPATQFRNTDRAITLVKQALQLTPQSRWGWKVLGEAEYRAGHWNAAIEAMKESVKLAPGDDPYVGLFMAMGQWQVGHKKEARKWYDQAVQGMEKKRSRDEDLRRLRAEAAALLGLPEPAAPPKREAPGPMKG
jgi:eukaryotic-like serine/threonine-protein kinase